MQGTAQHNLGARQRYDARAAGHVEHEGGVRGSRPRHRTGAAEAVDRGDAGLAIRSAFIDFRQLLLTPPLIDVAQQRVIEDMQLMRAALAIFAPPETLTQLEAEYKVGALPVFKKLVAPWLTSRNNQWHS